MEARRRAAIIALFLVITLTFAPLAHASWGRPLYDSPPADGLIVVDERVEAWVADGFAVTKRTVELRNGNDAASLQAAITFPVPVGAFVSNVTLVINGTTYYAVVKPKAVAETSYEEAVAAGASAALVRRLGNGDHQVATNIGPNLSATVTLVHEQFLAKSKGAYTLVLDSVASMARRDQEDGVRHTVTVTDARGVHDFRMFATDPSAPVAPITGRNESGTASIVHPTAGFRQTAVTWRTNSTDTGGILLTSPDASGRRPFVHIFDPDIESLGGSSLPKTVVFVLDKSGSMQGAKMDQMKNAFTTILRQLRATDAFAIITFDGIVTRTTGFTPVTEGTVDAAIHDLHAVKAEGSTNLHDALLAGFSEIPAKVDERVGIVVMLTDGEATAGVTKSTDIRKAVQDANDGRSALFTLGFGNSVDAELLEGLALENGGAYRHIRASESAEAQLADFYETIDRPILTDIAVDYGPGVIDVYPKRIPILFAGSELVIVGRQTTDEPLIATVTGRAPGGPFTATVAGTLSDTHDQVERAWAAATIAHLLDKATLEGPGSGAVEVIVALAMTHGFATPYTALFIDADAHGLPAVPGPAMETGAVLDAYGADLRYANDAASHTSWDPAGMTKVRAPARAPSGSQATNLGLTDLGPAVVPTSPESDDAGGETDAPSDLSAKQVPSPSMGLAALLTVGVALLAGRVRTRPGS